MSKVNQLERAIQNLEADRRVLDLAIERLKLQRQDQAAKPKNGKRSLPGSAPTAA